jgi:site-specific recombinase XerD
MGRSLSTAGPVVEKLLECYELYARAAGFSQSHINNMRMRPRLFDRFLGGIKDIQGVTIDDFRRFQIDLRERPVWQDLRTEKPRKLSSSSLHSSAVTIRIFFKWLKDEHFTHDNTLKSALIPPEGEKVSRAYLEDQMRAVLAADWSSARERAIFFAFIDSGIRLDEMSNLKIMNVDLKDGHAKVLGKGKPSSFTKTKSSFGA